MNFKFLWWEMKFLWKNWNDQLSLLLIAGIPGIWLVSRWLPMPNEVTGATIVAWTLIIQFYFRQRPPDEAPKV